MHHKRRGFMIACCAVMMTLPFIGSTQAQSIAVTFDDGPDLSDTTVMTAAQRNVAILAALGAAKIKSVLFVTRTDKDEQRIALIRQWGLAGHLIGNHTATHPNFGSKGTTLQSFETELLECDAALRPLPGFTKLFRFPYLKEGDTREKRDGFREFLKSLGYRQGRVTVDTSDWYYNQRLRERLEHDPNADRTAYRDAYLNHLYDRARSIERLSGELLRVHEGSLRQVPRRRAPVLLRRFSDDDAGLALDFATPSFLARDTTNARLPAVAPARKSMMRIVFVRRFTSKHRETASFWKKISSTIF